MKSCWLIDVDQALPVRVRLRRVLGPDAGEAVGLQLEAHRVRRRALPGAHLRLDAEQVLHVVAVLVGEHVGVDERPAGGAEVLLQLVVEGQVDVDELVAGAVEGPGAGVGGTAGRLHLAAEPDGVDGRVGPPEAGEFAGPVALDGVDVGDDGALELVVGVLAGPALALDLVVVGGGRRAVARRGCRAPTGCPTTTRPGTGRRRSRRPAGRSRPCRPCRGGRGTAGAAACRSHRRPCPHR